MCVYYISLLAKKKSNFIVKFNCCCFFLVHFIARISDVDLPVSFNNNKVYIFVLSIL